MATKYVREQKALKTKLEKMNALESNKVTTFALQRAIQNNFYIVYIFTLYITNYKFTLYIPNYTLMSVGLEVVIMGL